MNSTLCSSAARTRALCAASFAMVAWMAGPASAAPAIYKCFDRNLAILYTDQPCSGELLDVRPGTADPDALAALQREREALSRSMEQRITDQRRAALERGIAASVTLPIADNDAGFARNEIYYPAYATGGYGYGRGNSPRARSDRGRTAPPAERNRYVPNPPRGLPR